MTYNILVMGAAGGIGRQVVEQALASGHHVTAVLRHPAKLPLSHAHLELIQGDILHPETYEGHLGSQDVVISAIGVSGGMFGDKPTRLYSEGNATLLGAMRRRGVRRLYVISATAIEVSPVLPLFVRLVEKYVIQKLLRHMYADLRRLEALVRESDADWTIVRPPQLSDKALTGKYRVCVNGFLRNCLNISRADVAHFMLQHVRDTGMYRGTVEIGY